MTTDLMLVTRRAPTMADVRAAVADARRQAGLGAAELVGDFDDGDPMVELTAEVSRGELLLQIFRPTESLSTAADPYTVRIGREPPLGEDGHCRLTAMAMSGTATEPQTVAVLGVVRHLALACAGYLVVNGEYTPLDGVPDAPRTAAAPPPAQPPASRAFVEAFLTRPIDGAAGWAESMDLLRDLLDGTRDLRPRFIQRDKEWRPFLPTDPAPDWWPMSQYLLTPEPHVRWHLRPSHGPAQHYSQLSVAGDLDPDAAERFLPRLIDLARADLDYGLVHAWHEDEPGTGPTGLRHGADGPWMLFTPRDLTERLPNLYWAQIFGPPWVRLFGAETIATTPGHRIEEVADGHWLVQLTERLADVVTEHARFAAVRAQAKAHLGADAFYSPERGPRGRYRAPDIPTLKDRGLA